MHRRIFVKNTAILASAAVLGTSGLSAEAAVTPARPMTKKSLKWGMVKGDMSIMDKFKMLKDLGFDGVELDSPHTFNSKEILAARDKTGLELPGVVNSVHWKSPLSDPNPATRALCVESMKTALNDCKMYGGTTVLLVPAVVNQGISYQEAYERSQAEIRKLLPTAEKTGIKIALENVWNNFLLSPMEAARYVDEINHPLVGWYFDVGNIVRYGWPEHWIEVLGKRIMKLDIKEYSRKKQADEGIWKGFEVDIMDGDCNWPAVNKALAKIGYSGWASAEVKGGDRAWLADVSARMDRVFAAE
ncbi:sugar phosphate isomerase/epimerase family protein [Arundinibacter roseus]|uniref:Sugar phosphate isomerase/epimerase n=1 Tax=Arundinibacter roseus TaxID=2070510 RepID=A0A4R4K4U2_9BACT|nr:sugar phosphate isomerase/epimerase family protein [Arundinibacter roseus]TDB62283.1 sugar phosphate isomerase/epimerase [Arundinibacter roseus]